MTSEKINPNLKSQLFSADSNTVIQTIHKLKEKGNHLYLPVLFEILLSNPEAEIEKEILTLLGTVKTKAAVPVFIHAAKQENLKPIRKQILSACWQNGLNFNHYIPDLIDIIINDEWEIAFEAFTVIENLEALPEQKIINDSIEKLNAALKTATTKNEYFLSEIHKQLS